MLLKLHGAAAAAKRAFRIAKNCQKNKRVEKDWEALRALHNNDLLLQYSKDVDCGATYEDTPDDMQIEDGEWMAVEHRDPSCEFLGSPKAEVFKANTGFNVTIDSTQPAAKLERKPKPRVTHEVDGFAIIEQGKPFGQFELPFHVDPKHDLQSNTPRGKTKNVLRKWSSPTTNSSPSLPLRIGADTNNEFSSCLYGTNANVSPMGGGSFKPPSTPVNYLS